MAKGLLDINWARKLRARKGGVGETKTPKGGMWESESGINSARPGRMKREGKKKN